MSIFRISNLRIGEIDYLLCEARGQQFAVRADVMTEAEFVRRVLVDLSE